MSGKSFTTDEIAALVPPSRAARALNVSVERCREMIRVGDLPAVRTALGSLVRPEDLAALAHRRQRNASGRAPC
jgi:hypothetical protein